MSKTITYNIGSVVVLAVLYILITTNLPQSQIAAENSRDIATTMTRVCH